MDIQKTKKALTTPITIRIEGANYMVEDVVGIGYAKNQFSGGRFEKQRCRGCANWYADKIGQEWEALSFSEDFFRINNNPGCGFYFIDVRDCSVVVKKKQHEEDNS
jgi:hypothetical protein